MDLNMLQLVSNFAGMTFAVAVHAIIVTPAQVKAIM